MGNSAIYGWCTSLPASETPVPYFSGRVVDQAEILSAPARSRIGTMLQAHQRATGNQIAILTIDGIGSESIEDFAVRVFESWQLGEPEKNNGVLIWLHPGTPHAHRSWIRPGRHFYRRRCDRIIRNLMAPGFARVTTMWALKLARPASFRSEWQTAGSRGRRLAAPLDPTRTSTSSLRQWRSRSGSSSAFSYSASSACSPSGSGHAGRHGLVFVFLSYPLLVPVSVGHPRRSGGSDHRRAYVVLYPLVRLLIGRMSWYAKAQDDLKTKGMAQIGGVTFRGGSAAAVPADSQAAADCQGGGRSVEAGRVGW
jgi:uncharacterized protein